MAVSRPQATIPRQKLSPFQRLPPELLLLIFGRLLSCTSSSLSLVSPALACRTFYQCLQGESSLWTRLLIDIQALEWHPNDRELTKLREHVEIALKYSQQRPLSLTIHLVRSGENPICPDSDNISESLLNGPLSQLVTHLFQIAFPRCCQLTIETSSWLGMELLTSLVEGVIENSNNNLPGLKTFTLTYNPTNTIEAFSQPHALPLWRVGGISPLIPTDNQPQSSILIFPSLTHLTINNITHDWSLLHLSGLQTLRLMNIPHHNSPLCTDLHRILLANAETLTMLELSNISIADVEFVGGRITLPSVKTMTIGFAYPKDLVWAAQTLDSPALEELIVEDQTASVGWVSETDKHQIMEGYQELMRCFPLDHVRRLTLRDVVFYEVRPDAVESKDGPFAFEFVLRFRELEVLSLWSTDTSVLKVLKTSSDIVFPNLCLYLDGCHFADRVASLKDLL
ncbi:hypothetical protein PM082_019747 [Marasmius tenuissimus]|nr:hypothetical protein PM082_019747 [Marasmius tenuissimus]